MGHSSSSQNIKYSLENYRAFVIDDEMVLRELIAANLQTNCNMTVVTCSSGRKALKILAKDDNYDVIILDLLMPEMSGQDVFSSLPSDLQKKVLFMTGDAPTPSLKDFFNKSCQPFLFKPFKNSELVEAVAKLVS